MSKKAWAGRFAESENALMEKFNASIGFDKRLYAHDIAGSLAHARMLKKIGLLTAAELAKLEKGLQQVQNEIASGRFVFSDGQEDIHMAVESRLRAIIGPVAGKLHTARSRNDQVALDTRLFVRDETQAVLERLGHLRRAFVDLAERYQKTVMPGYTHLQRAQPILVAHHLLAYFEMLTRDADRFAGNLKRLDECPLGSGALAGSPIPIDRHMTAKALGFAEPTHNSLDAVSDRDFVLDYLSATSVLMMHLSRFAEELVLWNSQEFGFVTLPQGFCTGSSMMPQKVNPDAPELIRGKTGRVYGHLMSLLTTMKGLPLAYNKDMQEDKEPLFDVVDTVTLCLDVLTKLLPDLEFNALRLKEALRRGFVLATDVADYLARKGLPFRDAHAVVGGLVQDALASDHVLEDYSLAELKKHSPYFENDVFKILDVMTCVNARSSLGGTAVAAVKSELARARRLLRKKI